MFFSRFTGADKTQNLNTLVENNKDRSINRFLRRLSVASTDHLEHFYRGTRGVQIGAPMNTPSAVIYKNRTWWPDRRTVAAEEELPLTFLTGCSGRSSLVNANRAMKSDSFRVEAVFWKAPYTVCLVGVVLVTVHGS